MKRWAWLMLLATAGPGCVTVPQKIEEPEPPPVKTVEVKPRPPVRPEQVNESNALEKFQELQEEVERERNASLSD